MLERYDVLIKDSTIVDGTGRPAFKGSVGTIGERIAAMGDIGGDAARVIDGSRLVTCPGFVDPHSHADITILQYPLAENLVMQGITTFVGGNCGVGLAPIKDDTRARQLMEAWSVDIDLEWRTFGEWLSKVEDVGISLNYAPLIGHDAVRAAVMGEDFKREATPSEIAEMKALVDEGMRSGAFGLSSMFDTSPGEYAAVEEVMELAKAAREFGGLYSPHTRNIQRNWWADDPEEYGYGLYHGPKGEAFVGTYHGLLEVIEISRAAQIRLHIAHMPPAYMIPQPQPELLKEAVAKATLIEIVDKPRAEGLDVTFNAHATPWGSSWEILITDTFFKPRLEALALPEWLIGLGRERFVEKLKTRAFRDKVRDVVYSGRVKFGMLHPILDPYWMDCFRVLRCKNKEYEGKTVGEIARKRSPDRIVDAVYNESLEVVFDVLVEDPDATWAGILDKRQDPAVQALFLKHPAGMPGSDEWALPATAPKPSYRYHGIGIPPTGYGFFPYVIRTFVKERGDLSLEEAIMKSTSVPAQEVLGLDDRGIIREGAYADILVFDPEKISMRADFLEPTRPPEGIKHVLVNGTVVYEKMAHTGERPGKVLRHN